MCLPGRSLEGFACPVGDVSRVWEGTLLQSTDRNEEEGFKRRESYKQREQGREG